MLALGITGISNIFSFRLTPTIFLKQTSSSKCVPPDVIDHLVQNQQNSFSFRDGNQLTTSKNQFRSHQKAAAVVALLCLAWDAAGSVVKGRLPCSAQVLGTSNSLCAEVLLCKTK